MNTTATQWKWRVTHGTATLRDHSGIEPDRARAESLAWAAHDILVIRGMNPDALAVHVEAVLP